MPDFTRRNLLKTSAAAALGVSVVGVASGEEVAETDTPGAPSVKGELKRFANTAFGAEVTGPYVFGDGTLLFSNQHPEENNQGEFKNPGVGYFSGFQFELDGDNDDFEEPSIPDTEDKQTQIRSSAGEYTYLGQGRDTLAAYFLTMPGIDTHWVASFYGHKPEKVQRYANRVCKRATQIRDGARDQSLA